MQVQFLFLSWAVQWEERRKSERRLPVSREGPDGAGGLERETAQLSGTERGGGSGWEPPARGLMTRDAPAWPQRRGPGPGLTGQSFPRIVAAGTGGPTPDLTAQLFYQLWVLLLHLLSELLAPAGRGGAPGLSLAQGARPACPSRAGGPLPRGRRPYRAGVSSWGSGDTPCLPRSPAWQVHSRLDEAGQVVLRGVGAGSPQGVVATRNHAGHAAKRALDSQTVQPSSSDPHLALPLCRQWTSPGARTCPQPTLLTAACQFHQISQQHPFLA